MEYAPPRAAPEFSPRAALVRQGVTAVTRRPRRQFAIDFRGDTFDAPRPTASRGVLPVPSHPSLLSSSPHASRSVAAQ